MIKFVFEAQGMSPIEMPDWDEVAAVLGKLGRGGLGFATLSHHRRGYVQVAGTTLKLTIELREIAPDGSFSHFVLGNPDTKGHETSIHTGAGTIRLQTNEVLSEADALTVFRHFFEEQQIPARYVRRDTTQMFRRGD